MHVSVVLQTTQAEINKQEGGPGVFSRQVLHQVFYTMNGPLG